MKGKISGRILSSVVIVALSIIMLYQIRIVLFDYSATWLRRTLHTISLPSMERNALIMYGNKGAQFLGFISKSVPLDEPVAITDGYDLFSSQNMLQFFLFPRPIVICPCQSFQKENEVSEACKSCLSNPTHSIPAIGNFPPADLTGGQKVLLEFPGSAWYHGVYVPNSASTHQTESYIRMQTPMIVAAITDILLITLFFLVGASVAYTIDSKLEWADLLILGIPIGVGSFTWPLFLLSWAGVKITLLPSFSILIMVIVGSAVLRIKLGKKFIPPLIRPNAAQIYLSIRQRPFLIILLSIITILFGCSMIVALGNGYSLFDGIANWALKGYAIAETGSVTAGSMWGGHVLSYPQNIHLMISLFRLADGDVLPGSKLMYPFFSLSVLAVCYMFWVKHHLARELALLGAILIFSTPILFIHTTIGWGNLVFSSYLVLGVIYTVYAIEMKRANTFWISGLLMAFAAWTRPEGIGYVIATAVLLIVVMILTKIPLHVGYAWFISTFLIATSWLVFSVPWMAGDEIGDVSSSYLAQIFRGNFHLDIIRFLASYSLKQFTTTSTWGLLLVAILILLAGIFVQRRFVFSPQLGFLLGAAVICLLIPQFMFYAAGFSKTDFTPFLDASFDRAQFHGVILLFLTFMFAFAGAREGRIIPQLD